MAETSPTQRLKIVSLLGEKMNEEVYGVVLPTKMGRIEVLPGHEPLVTLLQAGPMAVRKRKGDPNEKLEFFALDGGVLKVKKNEITVLADEAESDREIAEQEAKEALARAKKALAESHDDLELEEAKRLVQHQVARLQVAELRRRFRRK